MEKIYSNNYISRNPLLIEEKNDIIVTSSIDYLVFNIDQYKNSNEILCVLFNNLRKLTNITPEHNFVSREGYNELKTYHIVIKKKDYSIVASRCTHSPFMPYLLRVQNPDRNILTILKPLLDNLVHYHITSAEFTLDFDYKNPEELFLFMKKYMLLSWRGEPLYLKYDSTKYLNNIRKSDGKGAKLYKKQIIGPDEKLHEPVRLEVTMKKKLLDRKKIRKIENLYALNVETIFKYITFNNFNYNLFINKLLDSKHSRESIALQIETIKNKIDNGFLHEVIETANEYLENKRYKQYHKFHAHFRERYKGCMFLDSGVFYLDSSMMDN
jgi:hypothetical protein